MKSVFLLTILSLSAFSQMVIIDPSMEGVQYTSSDRGNPYNQTDINIVFTDVYESKRQYSYKDGEESSEMVKEQKKDEIAEFKLKNRDCDSADIIRLAISNAKALGKLLKISVPESAEFENCADMKKAMKLIDDPKQVSKLAKCEAKLKATQDVINNLFTNTQININNQSIEKVSEITDILKNKKAAEPKQD